MFKKLLVSLILALVLSGCCGTPQVQSIPMKPVNTSPLVSGNILTQAGLEFNWQTSLALVEYENIDRLIVHGSRLFVFTDRNLVTCFNRSTGKKNYDIELTTPNTPIQGPRFYDDQMLFMTGKRLVVVNYELGLVVENKKLKAIGQSAAAIPDRNKEIFYISGSNHRLYAVDIKERYTRFELTADNDSLINNLLAEEKYIIFSTNEGNIVSVKATEAKKIWQSDLPTASIKGLVKDGPWIYASSADSKIYKFEAKNGSQGWKSPFHAGIQLEREARIGQNNIYQYAAENGFFAVNKTSGKQSWHIEKGIELLAEADSKAYIFTEPGLLTVMHNITGEKLYTVNFAGVNRFAANTIDSQMYIADKDGRVMCISIPE